jgi:hypothetical protein
MWVKVPLQSSLFTVYVPVAVPGPILPFRLELKLKVTSPFPSKITLPTSADGPTRAATGATTMNPVDV